MILPDRILSKMDKRDRPRGKAGQTAAEIAVRQEIKSERELHKQVAAWLDRHGIPYVHSRLDRRSTIREGWPDFTAMYNYRVACVELKTARGVLSEAQERVIAELQSAFVPVRVCRSLVEAVTFFKSHFLRFEFIPNV